MVNRLRCRSKKSPDFFLLPCADWLLVRGADAASFLHRILSQSVLNQERGTALPAYLLDARGMLVADMMLYRSEEGFLLQVPPGQAETCCSALNKYLIMENVQLAPAEKQNVVYLSVPEEDDVLRQVEWLKEKGYACYRSHRLGVPAVELLHTGNEDSSPIIELEAQGLSVGLGDAWDLMRIRAMRPEFARELFPGENPMVCGSSGRISFTKGCFVGQETVAKVRDRGRPPRILVRLHRGRNEDQLPLEKGNLSLDGNPVGALTSLAQDPATGGWLALAIVKFAAADLAHSLVGEDGAAWRIEQICDYKAGA